ncbi:GPR1/FUN34/YaaH family transporter [Williamsia sterculiae]|uniref:Uncharacterized protein n=1 Tax=Williamsia sterculiae TaxID=1344003 RepID=A0A1N7GZC4_9NOCA|nr:GPR1/FUN34/YaaH family transporter [Williamsia sterculiae]SIS17870.1 hypothetical protein SAMN05445060_3319 [Williamsia sterculiae]
MSATSEVPVTTSDTRGVAVTTPRGVAETMADPLPIAFGIFGFSFLVFAVRFVGVEADTLTGPTSEALAYALLIGGIAELLGGVLALLKGIAHSGWTMSVFGIWLIGFFLVIQHTDPAAETDSRILQTGSDGQPLPAESLAKLREANVTGWHTASLSWFVLMLAVPVIILAIRPILDRNITLIIVFASVIVVIFLFGSAFHSVSSTLLDVSQGKQATPDLGLAVTLLRTAGYFAIVAAAGLFWLFGKEVTAAEPTPGE